MNKVTQRPQCCFDCNNQLNLKIIDTTNCGLIINLVYRKVSREVFTVTVEKRFQSALALCESSESDRTKLTSLEWLRCFNRIVLKWATLENNPSGSTVDKKKAHSVIVRLILTNKEQIGQFGIFCILERLASLRRNQSGSRVHPC